MTGVQTCALPIFSVNRRSRREHLQSLRGEQRTMVFYEAPHKLTATLQDLLETLGERPIALVRELTKLHEEVIRTTLTDAVVYYAPEGGHSPRGEYVLVVGGAEKPNAPAMTPEQAATLAREYMADGMPPSEAAKKAAAEAGCKKGEVYRLLLD